MDEVMEVKCYKNNDWYKVGDYGGYDYLHNGGK